MSVPLENQSELIRAKMASLRRHMHKDAKRIVANTNRLLDWKDYAKQFPKALVAAGLAAGFLLGPGRKIVPSVKLSQESIDNLLAQRQQQVADAAPQRSELSSTVMRMLTGLAMSGGSILLQKGVEAYFGSKSDSTESQHGYTNGSI